MSTIYQSCFASPEWYHAMTLTERLESLRISKQKKQNYKVNTNLARRRIKRWKSQYPFTNDKYFARRLAIDNISEEEILRLLGEPIEALGDYFPLTPLWLIELERAFSSRQNLLLEEQVQKNAGFLNIIKPLIEQNRDRLHRGIQKLIQTHSELPFDFNTIADILFANLSDRLGSMLSRTLILELNVSRLQGVLEGDTPEERFQNFVASLGQPDKALAILQEYPVLARQLNICLQNWVNCSFEFLQRLCKDWHDLQITFSSQQNIGLLIAIDSSVSDRHRGGRSVFIAKFSSGLQLVYKPKSLAVDLHFQELLTWLNERGNHPPFKTQKILNRGTYGWVEYVEARDCQSKEEIWRFYERQGGYLAILYALEATDFHSENLIAAGEHPILIDLEALFHQRVGRKDVKQADRIAANTIAHSVLRVGLLPQRVWSSNESKGVDISGLGAVAGQLSPQLVPQWEELGTDQMRLTRKRIEMLGAKNRPTLNGTDLNVLDYVEAIAIGFTKIYRLLLRQRDRLLSASGLLALFAEDEVRVVFRPTRIYSLLLRDGFHPDVLHNALDRERLFDLLWGNIEHGPYLEKIIPAELKDLHQGDIPIFTTRPNSCDLWDSTGKRIANFFNESGMNLVRRRLQQLSEIDLDRQLWFIRASLTTLDMGANPRQQSIYYPSELQKSDKQLKFIDCQHLITAARAIGDRLEMLALRGEDDVSWLGLTLTTTGDWSIVPLGVELYSGLPGVILFLAHLGETTQERHYTTLARGALISMRRQLEQNQTHFKSIGAFNGWGGIIYTLTHLGVLWNRPELLAEAEALVEQLPRLIEQDEVLDVIGGAAGCIGSLISLYRCTTFERALAVAIQCGDYLIAHAQTMDHGISWRTKISKVKPLAGFSHGAAGIGWALIELASLTGETRFQTTALAAIEYERSLFRPEEGNWLDLRNFADTVLAAKNNQHSSCMTAWCHGAPGIGLARLRSLTHFDDPEIRSEINAALHTTLARGFGGNHSLCHGDFGNLELLLQASLTFDDPQWQLQVDRLATIILERSELYGWLCGTPLGVETPGLMLGLAGIGYELLRLALPKNIPSVLVLEAPKVKPHNVKNGRVLLM